MKVTYTGICPTCNGTGHDKEKDMPCHPCGGTGILKPLKRKIMEWYRAGKIERDKPWHTSADLCCRVSATESFWVIIYKWREDRPDIYPAGRNPCLPYVLHHTPQVERPDILAALPPPEMWASLPLLGSYQDMHPENCHTPVWVKPLK